MPQLQDLLQYAQAGDIEASKEFLEWASSQEAPGATLARVDEVVGRGPVHRAAEFGHDKYLKWILGLQVDHLQPDNSQTTALHLACVNGHVQAAKAIIDFDGPSHTALNKMNSKGELPVHWAAMKGHVEVLRLLNTVSKGGMKGMKDSRGNTALHYASKNNHEKATEFLLNIQCDPTTKNNDGEMPIHMAAREAAFATLYLLCVAVPLRERYDWKNNHGKTVVDCCTTHAAREMVAAEQPKKVASNEQHANNVEDRKSVV